MARLNAEMSAYEERDWQILEQIEPWGQRRTDYQMAQLARVIASCMSGRRRRPRFRDFLRLFRFEPQQDHSEQNLDQLFAIAKKKKKK